MIMAENRGRQGKIKRTVGWLFLLFLGCGGPRGFCDSAPVEPAHSGTVKPVQSEGVVLDSEVVHVYLEKKQYRVEVDYWFRNTGPAQTVMMGFPNVEGMYISAIKDFAAFVGPEKLTVRRKEAPPPEEGAPISLWYECFDVPLRVGEIVHVRNTYVQQYASDGTSKRMHYVLKTGRFWKGPIHHIQVYLHFPASPLRYKERRIAYGIAGNTDVHHRPDATLRIEPESYTLHGNTAEMRFEDVEPDFDIRVTLPPWLSETVSASSTLKDESGHYSYEPQNVTDGDCSTSWVEGASGPGIGERLRLDIAPSMEKGKATGFYLIDRIGIINGYAASQELYRANNHRSEERRVGKECRSRWSPYH